MPGTVPQWIIDARKAKKARKLAEKRADAIKLSDNPLKRRREMKALKRSTTATTARKKNPHGRQR